MPLEIKEDHGVFEVLGDVTAQNVGALRAYYDSVLESQEQVIVSLEKVTVLDASAAHFFEKLYRESAERNKVMALIGRQNDTVLETLTATKTNYILSPDRI